VNGHIGNNGSEYADKNTLGNGHKTSSRVIATRPTTAPTQKPTTEGFLPRMTSKNIQERPAAAAAVFVVENADTASELAPGPNRH